MLRTECKSVFVFFLPPPLSITFFMQAVRLFGGWVFGKGIWVVLFGGLCLVLLIPSLSPDTSHLYCPFHIGRGRVEVEMSLL